MSMTPPGVGHRIQAHVITLRELSARRELTRMEQGELDRCILPWIPLMQGTDESDIIEQWRVLAEQEPEDRFRKDYPGLAIIYADLLDRRQIWEEGLEGFDVKESRVVLEWQQEAEVKNTQRNILSFLAGRFQTEIPSDIQQLVRDQSDSGVLERWVTEAAQTESLDTFRTVIQQPLPNGNGS